MTQIRASGATDVGVIRTENQDKFAISENTYVVADGMGGHLGGEVAASLATEAFIDSLKNKSPLSTDDLIEAVKAANKAVFQRAQEDPSVQGMGTTLTAITLIETEGETRIGIVHVGDSRAYLFRNGELQQLTNDHSLVEELVRTGQLTPAEAEEHPRRNILTRALGVEPTIDADVIQVLPLKGDRYLLCSDGLVREITDDQVAAVLRRLADAKEASSELVSLARKAGGADNITVVIAEVTDSDVDPMSIAREADVTKVESPIIETISSGSSEVIPNKDRRDYDPKANTQSKPWLTPRVVLFLFVFLLVVGGVIVLLTSYVQRAYFVGLKGENIAIYKGRPGNQFGIKPKLVVKEPLILSDIPASRRNDVKEGKVFSTKKEAENYVNNLVAEAQEQGIATSTTTLTTVATATTVNSGAP
jgi:serine/threonine protein phosphatase PrpC